MPATTLALLGATGGAGTTRTTLELATLLATAGDDVAVLDAALDTQGLARHLEGALNPDLTSLLTDEADRPLADGFVTFDPSIGGRVALADEADVEGGADGEDTEPLPDPGRVVCCPVRASFERLARAKTTDAAQALERRIREASESFDHVLVDVPPLGTNPGVAAVMTVESVAVVAPATAHGMDAVQMTRGRLQDVGTDADAVVTVERPPDQKGEHVDDADVDALVPWFERDVPACLSSPEGVAALESVAEATLGRSVSLPVTEPSVFDRVSSLR